MINKTEDAPSPAGQHAAIDARELIDCIISRSESQLDRIVALMTFCAWMRWPNDKDLIYAAQVAAKEARSRLKNGPYFRNPRLRKSHGL